MKNKRTLSFLLAISMVASLCIGILSFAATSFKDVPSTYWANKEIQYVVTKGLFNGTTDTTFSPEAQMKRGQLAAVLYRYAGSPKVTGTSGYTDVASTAYYADACAWAKQNGIFMADKLDAASLNPDEGITRSEFAVMLYNFAKLNGKAEVNNSAENPYADMTNVSSEIKTAILNWAVPAGILGGTTDTTMNPFGAIKRSHVAAMLYRYETKIANPGSVVETPVETTPSTSDKVYTAGDTLVLKQGGTYNVTFGVGETVAIQNQIDEAWSSFDGNKFVDGKRIAEMHWDDSANSLVIEGLAASDVTLQCLSTTDYETVLATINVTVTNGSSSSSGNTGSTMGDLDANMAIREEIVRLTNEVRKENGVAALPVDDAMMNAAQMAAEEYAKTGSFWSGHNPKMELEMRKAAGVFYGGGSNLTGFYADSAFVAQDAVDNWVNSPGHFSAMIDSTLNNMGIGVAQTSNKTWVCIQFFGDLDSNLGTYA